MTPIVEKASKRLGIIVFKCLAVDPDIFDADEQVVDAASMEAAFYDFMAHQPEAPVDLDHKTVVKGQCVAGWYFADENLFRVAFKPDDPAIVERALNGDFDGSSFYAAIEPPIAI